MEEQDKSKKTNFIMGELAYKKAIWTLALPAITSFLVLSLYITIDSWMVSFFVGGEGLAAMQYFQPVSLFLVAVLFAIATGTKILVSIVYGEKDDLKANKVMASGFLVTLVLSLITTLLIFFLGPLIPLWMGAKSNIATLSKIYFFVFTFGIVPQAFVNFSESMFTAKGYTKIILVFTVISQVLNLSLDYLLMGVFKWGIGGAAFATVFSMYVSLICYIFAIAIAKKEFIFNPFKYKLFSKTSKKIAKLGFPFSITQIIIAIKFMLVIVLLSSFNDSSVVIVYSALLAILNVCFIPFFGLASAVMPMIGFNFGSKNYSRMKNVWKYKIKVSLIYFFIFISLLWLFPQFFLGIFNAGHYQYSEWMPRIITMGSLFFPLMLAFEFLFQAVGQPKEALKLNLIREVFIFIPALFILRLFNDPLILLFAYPLADILGIILIYLFVKTKLWKKLPQDFQNS